jgi:hypothetical protein
MWRRLPFSAAAALLGAVIPAVALAQSSAPLQLRPAGAWTADFADNSCALRRSFSDGTTTVVFEMNQVAPGDGLEVAVASGSLEARDRAPRTQFLPGSAPKEATFYRPVSTVDGLEGFAVYDTMLTQDDQQRRDGSNGSFVWPEADREQREKAITGYAVARAFDKDLVLLTGPLHEPMNVMRQCLDDLVTQWGLDPAAQRTLSRPAEVDFDATWVDRMVLLQRRLLDSRSPAAVRARLLVDEAGKVTGCRLLNLPPETDDAYEFCGEMEKRAQLTPALDAAGRQIKSFYIWEILIATRTTVSSFP